MTSRPAAVVVLGAAALLALAGCGDGGSAERTASSSAVHNEQDVTFAQQMVVHHQGALDLAGLAVTRADDPEVRALAEEVVSVQEPEITTMSGWLKAWGEPATEGGTATGSGAEDLEHVEDAGHGMAGTVGEEQLAELASTSGPAFDRAFLDLLAAHHEGALEMAATQRTDGAEPRAVALAEAITTSQTEELERIRVLAASTGSGPGG